jgi:beta-glucosidase
MLLTEYLVSRVGGEEKTVSQSFRSQVSRYVLAFAVALAAMLVPAVEGARAARACGTHPWCDESAPAGQRASLLLSAMTTAERLELVADGKSGDARLGIPPIKFIDGPNGLGEGSTNVTAFPDAETIAASWDTSLAGTYGQALGSEAAGKGDTLVAAPTINIVRTPLWGREAETLGEDPFLTGSLVAPEIRGIQSAHVIAQVKHFAGNNQEIDRFGQPLASDAVSDQVSQRALQEIYFPGFKSAVQEGHVASVMCSYNRINLVYSCQNPLTLGTLKGWGLRGFVGPDSTLAVRDDAAAVNAGVDNMQLGSLATATGANELSIITAAFNRGQISTARLNDAAQRTLTAMFQVGLFDHARPGSSAARVSTRAHLSLATRVAEDATVLLKNSRGALPLPKNVGSIAVIGHDAGSDTRVEENGSPAVLPGPVISPLSGIRSLVGHSSKITYAAGTLGDARLPDVPSSVLTPSSGSGHGLRATFFSSQTPAGGTSGAQTATRVDPNVDFTGPAKPLSPIPNSGGANSAEWTGTLHPAATGTYRFSLTTSGIARLYLNGHLVISANDEFFTGDLPGGIVSAPGGPTITFQGLAALTKGRPVSVRVTYAAGSSIAGTALKLGWEPPERQLLAQAVSAARRAKVAVVFVNDVSTEGADRPSLSLPGDQDRLVQAVAAANRHTIVVLHTAGPVLMPWLSKVVGVLEAWYPGQQSGTAIAATLFGRSDPSGHLPVTFPRSTSQGAIRSTAQYPGVGNLAQYSEGIFVGYRYYDAHHQTPLFPFGYGLSYTSFALSHLTVSRNGTGYRASMTVRNTGRVSGAEVVQGYLQFPAAAGEPPRQLKAYAKVSLRPGRSAVVHLNLPRSSYQYFSSARNAWVTAGGRYRLYVGTSTLDLPLSSAISVNTGG